MRQAWRHGPQPPLPQLPRIQVKAPLLHVATRTHVAKKTPVYATPTRTSWPWLVVPVGLYEARFRAAQGLPKDFVRCEKGVLGQPYSSSVASSLTSSCYCLTSVYTAL